MFSSCSLYRVRQYQYKMTFDIILKSFQHLFCSHLSLSSLACLFSFISQFPVCCGAAILDTRLRWCAVYKYLLLANRWYDRQNHPTDFTELTHLPILHTSNITRDISSIFLKFLTFNTPHFHTKQSAETTALGAAFAAGLAVGMYITCVYSLFFSSDNSFFLFVLSPFLTTFFSLFFAFCAIFT